MSQELVVLRQGEGEILSVLGTKVKFLCTGDKTDRVWSLMEVVLPKHAGPPPHDHPWGEAYYVIEGQVRFSVEGQEQIIRAGEFLYAPSGTLHGFQGDVDSPSRMLIIDAPSHAEAFFREVNQEVRSPADKAKIPEIGARNQIYFRV